MAEPVFIGASDSGNEGTFVWADEEIWSFNSPLTSRSNDESNDCLGFAANSDRGRI